MSKSCFNQINLQENVLRGFLVSLFFRSLRNSTPPFLHPTYLLSRQDMEYVREEMGLENKLIGYVYLVDRNLKIRLAGHALPLEQEVKTLAWGVEELLKRVNEGIAKDKKKPSSFTVSSN
jgi:mitochondrial ATPase complex subunit ATP10